MVVFEDFEKQLKNRKLHIKKSCPLLSAPEEPRGVVVNHTGLWSQCRQFESARGYLFLFKKKKITCHSNAFTQF